MKDCFDCIHYPVCENCTKICAEFKGGEKFIELPCSLGDEVYVINAGDFSSDYMPFIEKAEIWGISQILLWDGTPSEWGVSINAQRYSFLDLGRTWFVDEYSARERLDKIMYGN